MNEYEAIAQKFLDGMDSVSQRIKDAEHAMIRINSPVAIEVGGIVWNPQRHRLMHAGKPLIEHKFALRKASIIYLGTLVEMCAELVRDLNDEI